MCEDFYFKFTCVWEISIQPYYSTHTKVIRRLLGNKKVTLFNVFDCTSGTTHQQLDWELLNLKHENPNIPIIQRIVI